jgi:putative oxidoreductase
MSPDLHASLADLALVTLRLAIGAGSFVHGINKLGHVERFAGSHALPPWLAWVATGTQIGGGALMVVGLATPIAALGLTVFGAWATFELIWRKREKFAAPGQHSWDAGVMYTVIPFALLCLGPGRLSLDYLLFGR